MPHTGSSDQLAHIDHALAHPSLSLQFAPPLEREYLKHYLGLRSPMVAIWASIGTLLYCLGYLGDQSMMSPSAETLKLLRFGIFLPYGIAVILIMWLRPSPLAYESLTFGVGVLGALLPMSVLATTETPYAFVYQIGTVSTLLYMVVLLRPRFYVVLTGCLCILAIQLSTTAINGSFDATTYTGIVTFYVTFTAFLMLAAYGMEQGERRSFLHQQRSNILTAKLCYLSRHDDLTGLLNRRALTDTLQEVWKNCAKDTVAAVMIDIDHFKLYNDIHGHVAGDNCIRTVSAIVTNHVDSKGKVFRYGGEEILVILPGANVAAAEHLAETIRLALEAEAMPHFGLQQPGAIVTASFGVAKASPQVADPTQLLASADAALYQAKRRGRNRVFA